MAAHSNDHSQSASRKATPEDGERVDAEFGFRTSINRMKMCRIVVIEIHTNGDPKKTAYFRHEQPLPIWTHAADVPQSPCKRGRFPSIAKGPS